MNERPEAGRALLLTLHAHLPYVSLGARHVSWEERWLYQAMWQCYLPLIAWVDRGRAFPFSLSLSGPLIAMLEEPERQSRFILHAERLLDVCREAETRTDCIALGPALTDQRRRVQAAISTFRAIDGDLIGAWTRQADAQRIELLTTAASHAFLPGLSDPTDIRAQLTIGRTVFERATGRSPSAFWLPECGFNRTVGAALASACPRVHATVIDAHGQQRRVPEPVRSPDGFLCLPRDPGTVRRVWSRDVGYPGRAPFADYHQTLEAVVNDESARELRVFAVTERRSSTKRAYDPSQAHKETRQCAADFVGQVTAGGRSEAPMLCAFDAELFGHWWLEGIEFIDAVGDELRRQTGAIAMTMSDWTTVHADLIAEGELFDSTWGEGGYNAPWTGPDTARWWRHIHHTSKAVRRSARSATSQLSRRFAAQAIRELVLGQASDWLFMIQQREMGELPAKRLRDHLRTSQRLAAASLISDKSTLPLLEKRQRLFPYPSLEDDTLISAFLEGI